MISSANAWCLAFDNFSTIPDWLSDAFCRLSTGGGFSTRQNYTDSAEMLFEATRPVIINGIDLGISRGDLLDRTLPVTLPSISQEGRLTEAEFWQSFETAQPRVLGALLDAVACGMRRLPEVRLPRLPRMADFAVWVTACEPALGWAEGTFLAAYERNRHDTNELALEGSPLVPALRALIAFGNWSGTATELLEALNTQVSYEVRRERSWPKNARSLSAQLNRLAPNLRSSEIVVQTERTPGNNSRKIIRIENT
jgi:hypothetical protein